MPTVNETKKIKTINVSRKSLAESKVLTEKQRSRSIPTVQSSKRFISLFPTARSKKNLENLHYINDESYQRGLNSRSSKSLTKMSGSQTEHIFRNQSIQKKLGNPNLISGIKTQNIGSSLKKKNIKFRNQRHSNATVDLRSG